MSDKIVLPVFYYDLDVKTKRRVKEMYLFRQDYKCMYCKEDIYDEPPKRITDKEIDWDLFPEGFLNYPIHLQHCHVTGMTEGVVHAYCNAVMWQYEGR